MLLIILLQLLYTYGNNCTHDDLPMILGKSARWYALSDFKCDSIIKGNKAELEKRLVAAAVLKLISHYSDKSLISLPELSELNNAEQAFWCGIYASSCLYKPQSGEKYFILSLVMDPNIFNKYRHIVKKRCPDIYVKFYSSASFASLVRSAEKGKINCMSMHDSDDPVANYYNGVLNLQQGEYERAAIIFADISDDYLLEYIGDAYWDANQKKDATDFYRKAIAHGSKNAFFMLALLQISSGEFEQAERTARQGINYNVKNRFLLLEALRLQKKINLVQGRQIVGKISASERETFLFCYFLGCFYSDFGEFSEAILWLNHANRLAGGGDVRPLKKLSEIFEKRGDHIKTQR